MRTQPFRASLRTAVTSAVATLALAMSCHAHAAEFEVVQLNKAFGTTELKVKIGDTVSFKNADPFMHNIFSLSDAKTFDLGSYPAGQSRPVSFDKPGTVEVECALHPGMKMTILVRK